MRKSLLLTVMCALVSVLAFSQTGKAWSEHFGSRSQITTYKAVARQSFPKEFKLYDLNVDPLRQQLFSIVGNATKHSTVVSLPSAEGKIEQFEVFEASNFEPALQAKYPEIRAFSGKGITDKYSTLKLSISPQGVQVMIFRTEKENEFIEPYSNDRTVYAVYKSQRVKGSLPWTCTTDDKDISASIRAGLTGKIESNAGELRTMRLAQSCNGEYANYFGAFSAADVALVLAAFNTTLTRCNGVYEKDLALHLNLIANTADVIFYDPATDPYSNNLSAWNSQLQTTLTNIIGEDNYDIGHMFGASGGGGNAGCIGCVCNSGKGSGITSPADGIPEGDNFDIDYVVHEVGHQLGGNHTFSMSLEGTGQNKEVGSGITIMGYAGITSYDVAPHSIDIFHETSIGQIQANLATKSCPITTNITATNATPVVAPVSNVTIPISTPFTLTGSATDANAGDVLTYCWEQNDNSTVSGANSVASPTKVGGPNWLSFSPTVSPTRTFPRLSTVLAGLFVTPTLPGGDAAANIEALSSVSRTLNFRLTVRDNSPYSSTPPLKVGQTAFTDVVVTVTNTSGPFAVTVPNTAVSWPGNSAQTITWSVNNTTAAPVSCANVKISLSTDGGLTFPTVLAASTPNDGTETLTIPAGVTTTARIKVEAVGNVFFDISNTNFSIVAPLTGYGFTPPAPTTITCAGPTTATATLATTSTGGYVTPIVLTATAGVPAGATVTITPSTVVPGNNATVTLNNTNTLSAGTYNITITGVSGTSTQTTTVSFVVSPGTPPTVAAPADQAVCIGSNASFSVTVAGALSYQWQVSTDGGANYTAITGATASTYTVTGVTAAQNNNRYRVIVTTQCSSVTSGAATLTVQAPPAITTQPAPTTVCAGTNASFTVVATGTNLTYQWQLSTDGGLTYNNVTGATAATITVTAVTNPQSGNRYRVIVSGTCPSAVTSTGAILTVGDAAAITASPVSVVTCVGSNATFTVTASGTNLTYQWQVSTDGGANFTNITGQTATSLTLTAVTAAQSGNQYRAIVFSCTPTGITSAAATLTVNTPIAIGTQPSAVVTCLGTNATFTIAATGTGATYQWQYAATCAGTFTNIAGATSATLTLNSVTLANGGAYRVVVGGACGAVTSSCVTLTVNSPVTISQQPVDASICLPATSATFSVTAAGTALVYQWQVSTDGGATFTNIPGATGASYTVTPLTASLTGYKYRAILSGTCTPSLTTNVVTLTVNTPVSIVSQPVATAVCAGSNASFGVSALGSTITYQWQVSVNGGAFVNLTNTAPYSGVNTNQLTVTGATTNLSNNVYRVVVAGVPCGSVNSNPAKLTVNPLPSVVLTLASYPRITPYTPTTLSATISPVGRYTYQWYKNDVLLSNVTTPTIQVTPDDFGEYKVVVTDSNFCSSAISNRVTVADSASSLLFVYPNPSTGPFQVRYYNAGGGTHTRTLTIYDSKGVVSYERKYTLTGAYGRMDVNMSSAGKGVYFIDLRDANGKRLSTGRVVIN